MIHPLAPGTTYYRAVEVRYAAWRHILSARGTFHTIHGGRFNFPGFQVAYVADDPLVAVAEMAYYAAHRLQTHLIPNGFWSGALSYPFALEYRLWAFTLTAPVHVIDVEHPQALATFGHSQYVLVNPSQAYSATQHLAARVMAHRPAPQPGVRGPSVRSRHRQANAGQTQLALFVGAVPPTAQRVQVWRLVIEFRDMAGQHVTAATDRVDWETAHFTLGPTPRQLPAGPAQPPGLRLNTVHPVRVNYS